MDSDVFCVVPMLVFNVNRSGEGFFALYGGLKCYVFITRITDRVSWTRGLRTAVSDRILTSPVRREETTEIYHTVQPPEMCLHLLPGWRSGRHRVVFFFVAVKRHGARLNHHHASRADAKDCVTPDRRDPTALRSGRGPKNRFRFSDRSDSRFVRNVLTVITSHYIRMYFAQRDCSTYGGDREADPITTCGSCSICDKPKRRILDIIVVFDCSADKMFLVYTAGDHVFSPDSSRG